MKGIILISAYNSAGTLPGVLTNLKKYPFLEVLLIDDGSTDTTADIAYSYDVQVIRHKKNLGKGAALQSGFHYATENNFDFVITQDADGQHPAESICGFLSAHEKHPQSILLGSRKRDKRMPWPRRISNAVSAFLITKRIHRKIYDAQCGFRLIPQPFFSWKCSTRRGFIYESEMLICFAENDTDFRFIPIPTLYSKDSKSKMTYFRSTFGFISMYITSFFKDYRKKRYDLQ